MHDKQRNLSVKTQFTNLGSEKHSLEKIIVTGHHSDHINVAPALSEAVKGLFKISIGKDVVAVIDFFKKGGQKLFVICLFFVKDVFFTKMKNPD